MLDMNSNEVGSVEAPDAQADPTEYFTKAASVPVEPKGDQFQLPSWLDVQKIEKGKKFVQEHFFAIFFAHLISLIFLFCYDPVRRILTITRKSDTTSKSRARYLSTLTHIKCWYEQDLLLGDNDAVSDINYIRQVHAGVVKSLNGRCEVARSPGGLQDLPGNGLESLSQQKQSPGGNHVHVDLLSEVSSGHAELAQSIRTDWSTMINWPPSLDSSKISPVIHMSQMDMLVTQFCFVGFVSTYPKTFGIKAKEDSSEGIEGFIHLWALIAYLLGVQDEFNVCLEKNKDKREIVMKEILFRNFLDCQTVSVNLWAALVDGVSSFIPFVSLRAILLFVGRLMASDTQGRQGPQTHQGHPELKLPKGSTYDRLCDILIKKCFNSWLHFYLFRWIFNGLLRLAIFASSLRYLRKKAGRRNKITSW